MELYKHRGADKHDGQVMKTPGPVHDSWYVSATAEQFHNPAGYAYRHDNRPGFSYGINKRVYKVSSAAITIDSSDIGKSDY